MPTVECGKIGKLDELSTLNSLDGLSGQRWESVYQVHLVRFLGFPNFVHRPLFRSAQELLRCLATDSALASPAPLLAPLVLQLLRRWHTRPYRHESNSHVTDMLTIDSLHLSPFWHSALPFFLASATLPLFFHPQGRLVTT